MGEDLESCGKKHDLPSGLPPSWPPVPEVSPSESAPVSFSAHCPPPLAEEVTYTCHVHRKAMNGVINKV